MTRHLPQRLCPVLTQGWDTEGDEQGTPGIPGEIGAGLLVDGWRVAPTHPSCPWDHWAG